MTERLCTWSAGDERVRGRRGVLDGEARGTCAEEGFVEGEGGTSFVGDRLLLVERRGGRAWGMSRERGRRRDAASSVVVRGFPPCWKERIERRPRRTGRKQGGRGKRETEQGEILAAAVEREVARMAEGPVGRLTRRSGQAPPGRGRSEVVARRRKLDRGAW